MPIERAGYRENLELIREKYPNKNILTVADVERFTGMKRKTLMQDKTFPVKKINCSYIVTVAGLARWLP